MEGDIPDGLIVVLLLAMMVMKFFLVASWFMHLRTDQPVFKRLFVVGAIAAPVLYIVVLATLHGILPD
jgi:cytochrome c oxidase subunit 4